MSIDLKDLFSTEDDKFITILLKAINKASNTEFDYLKFKHSVGQLMEMGMDEAQAIKSTYATATTMGVNKKSLLKSGTGYLRILEKEKRHFAEALVRQQKERVSKKNEQLGTYAKEVNLHNNKIEQLQKEIAIYEQKIEQLHNDIDGETQKITQTREQFMKAYDHLDQTIQTDVAQIEDLL